MQDREYRKSRKPHVKREKAVESEVLNAAKDLGFDLSVVDSSSFLKTSVTEAGFSDLVGNWKSTACFIELKAPGKRRTVKPHQKKFLQRKIDAGCFAVVCDGAENLTDLFRGWMMEGQAFLSRDLSSISE